jgi:branched-chain amino acid transport system permease protein
MKWFAANRTFLSALIGALAVTVLPFLLLRGSGGILGQDNYWLHVLVIVGIYTMLAVGLNLLMGYAGQVSLGHAAFYGLGAYTTAVLTTRFAVSPWLAMLCGLVLTGVVALLIGIPCLRLRGHYLAMATLGFGWIVYIVMKQLESVTGGTQGIERVPKLALGTFIFDSDVKRFYLTWVFALLVLIISANIVNSRTGRAFRAMHGSEQAAAALGINIAGLKLQVFVLSAVFASLAGSLYAHVMNYVNPSPFDFHFSVQLVVMTCIGGMASVWGAPLGAATITFLKESLQMPAVTEWLDKFHLHDIDVIIHGLILIVVMVFLPGGLVSGVTGTVARLRRKRAAAAKQGVTP